MRLHLVLAVLVSVLGCDGRPPAPPPMPPNVLDKALFASDRGWYFQKSIIEIPYNMPERNDVAPFTTPVMPTARVQLEFQQSWLVGYRVEVPLSGDVNSQGIAEQKQIEFAFPLVHVDVVSNQLIDNPTRRWWERTHVIVDWAHPAIEGRGYVDVVPELLEGERWLVTDPGDPEVLRIEPGAFDFVVRGRIRANVLEGPQLDLPYWCGDRDAPNCTGTRISWRLSFRKVKPPTFEPTPVEDPWSIATFPVFKTASRHYSDQYGFTDASKRSLGVHFNVYQTAFGSDGARLPTFERVLTQRAVHLSPNLPREGPGEVLSSIETSFRRWNDALREAVSARRRSDCARAGRTDCDALLGQDATWSYFVICRTNPVTAEEASATPVCGPTGKVVRLGDIDNFLVYWSDQPSLRAPTAFAYWNPDFTTGELLGALIYFNASLVDRTVMQIVDGVRISNGDARFRASYASGQATWDWVTNRRLLSSTAFEFGNALSAEVERASAMPRAWSPAAAWTPEQVADVVRRPDWSWVDNPRALQGLPARWSDVDLGATVAPVVDRLARDGRVIGARRKALTGTSLERSLVTTETLLAANLPANATLDEKTLEVASPLREGWWARRPAATDTHAIDAFYFEPDVEQIAQAWRGRDVMEVFHELRRELMNFVGTHEVGHTLGLRHNFAGSFDAMNYDDEYWRLRNDGAVGPRFSDPMTATERAARIDRYAQSTVMDYLPQFIYGLPGVGKADRAAIKFLYGSMVEVLDGPRNRDPDVVRMANELVTLNRTLGSPPPLIVPASMPTRFSLHYTELPRVFELTNRATVPIEDLRNTLGNPSFTTSGGATVTADGRVVVPYMACADELSTRLGCDREDLGADPFEIVQYATNRARGNYLFSHYRRALLGFPNRRANIGGLAGSAIRYTSGGATFINALFGGDPRATAPGEGLATLNAAFVLSLDYLGEQLTMPDVGTYAQGTDFAGTPMFRFSSSGALRLDTDVARFFTTSFYQGTEYSGYLRPEVSRLGWALDKEEAVDSLVGGAQLGQAFGVVNQTDLRATLVAFYRAFPQQLNQWLGAVLTDDFARYAPAWDATQRRLVRPVMSNPTWSPGALPRVDPMVPLNVKLRLIAQGYPALTTSTTNRNFPDLVRIWVLGSGHQVTTTRKVSFADSLTGKTYEALSFPDGGGAETGIGARMLLRAAAAQARLSTNPMDRQAQQTLDDLRYLIETVRTVVARIDDGAEPAGGGP